MTIQEMQKRALEIAAKYDRKSKKEGRQHWDASARMAGFVADVGELSELVMAKQGYPAADNVDGKLAHELSDCLWSVLVLADMLEVDIEEAFEKTMHELDARLAE